MPKSKQSRKPKPAGGAKESPNAVASPKIAAPKTNDSKTKEAKSRASSKQEMVLGLLRRPEGATIATIIKATRWQQHSVRGFFAGVVRKRLGLTLESDKSDGDRTYRIVGGKASKSKLKTEAAKGQGA